MLYSLGYKVAAGIDIIRTVSFYNECRHQVDSTILRIFMLDMNGEYVFLVIHKIDPDAKVLFSSGYSIGIEGLGLLDKGAFEFVKLPLRLSRLSLMVSEILQYIF